MWEGLRDGSAEDGLEAVRAEMKEEAEDEFEGVLARATGNVSAVESVVLTIAPDTVLCLVPNQIVDPSDVVSLLHRGPTVCQPCSQRRNAHSRRPIVIPSNMLHVDRDLRRGQ